MIRAIVVYCVNVSVYYTVLPMMKAGVVNFNCRRGENSKKQIVDGPLSSFFTSDTVS